MLKLVFRPWPSLDPGQALSPASLLGAFVSPYLPVTHAHTHSLPLSVGACRVWWGVRGRCVGWTCCGIRSATVAALLFARPKRQCFVRLRRRSGLSQCCRVQDVDAQMLMSAARYLFASKNEMLDALVRVSLGGVSGSDFVDKHKLCARVCWRGTTRWLFKTDSVNPDLRESRFAFYRSESLVSDPPRRF